MTSRLVGLIAGSGALPGLLARAYREAGGRTFIVGLTGSADAAQFDQPPDDWSGLGEPTRIFSALRVAGVKDVIMAGGVRRPDLSTFRPDFRAAAFLARVAIRAMGDDTLMRALSREIEAEGFRIVGIKDVAPSLLAPLGPIGRYPLPPSLSPDAGLGFMAARDLGQADLGQAVVVAGGKIIDCESKDGTDALIARVERRNHEAAAILVKCRKPQQDDRFDLPAIGPDTVAACRRARIAGIVVEHGETVVIDRKSVAAAADAAEMFVVGAA